MTLQTTADRSTSWTEFRWYLGGHSAYFAAMGVQNILYPYLVTFVLLMPADMVGIAQMFTMLPMFGLVLIGGVTADRAELRMHLVRLQVLTAMPMLVLTVLVVSNQLTFALLIFCGVLTGSLGAFIMPARDSLLSRVAQRSPGGDIQQAVTMITGVQFAAQVAGMLVGRFINDAGAGVIILIVVMAYLTAAWCTTHLRPAPPHLRNKPTEGRMSQAEKWRRNFAEIREGLMIVRNSDRMFPVVLMMFAGGLLIMGVFMVLLQVLIRDVYGRTIIDYSTVMIGFMLGVTATTTILARYSSRLKRPGRAMMLAWMGSMAVMLGLHFEPPLWGVQLLVVFWGTTAGVTMSLSRAIVQEAAGESHRARVMSVFQLGFLGGGPLGALLMGYSTKLLGPLDAILIPFFGLIAMWIILFLFTDLWKIQRAQHAL